MLIYLLYNLLQHDAPSRKPGLACLTHGSLSSVQNSTWDGVGPQESYFEQMILELSLYIKCCHGYLALSLGEHTICLRSRDSCLGQLAHKWGQCPLNDIPFTDTPLVSKQRTVWGPEQQGRLYGGPEGRIRLWTLVLRARLLPTWPLPPGSPYSTSS